MPDQANNGEHVRTPLSRRATRLGDSLGVGALVGVVISFAYQELTQREMPEAVAIAAGVILSSVAMKVRNDIIAMFRALVCLISKRRERRRTRKG